MTTKSEILKAVRAKCLDCGGGSYVEVDLCGSGNCPLYAFRSGRDPAPRRTGESLPVVKLHTPQCASSELSH